MVQAAESETLHRRHLIGYGIGSVGTGAFTTVPGLLLMFYMTNYLEIPAQLAALGVFVPKMWDVIVDPFIGILSDRTRHKRGRRPYLLAGAVMTGVFFCALFNVPDYPSVSARFWHVTTLYVLCTTGYAIFSIPYIALPAEMTSVPQERTRIVSYRMVFLFLGIVLSGGLSPVLIDRFGGGLSGYGAMSVILGGIIGSAMFASYVLTPEHKGARIPLPRLTWGAVADGPLKNTAYLKLFATYAIQLTGFGCLLVGLPYYTTYVLGGGGAQLTVLFLLLNGASIVSIPIWLKLSARVGKVSAFKASGMILVLSMVLFWAFSQPSTVYGVYGAILCIGVGFAGQQVLGLALLPDLVTQDSSPGGASSLSGIYTGIWLAGEKTGFAVSAFAVGTILGITGFVEGASGVAEQSPSVVDTIRFCTAIAPAIFIGFGLIIMRSLGNDLGASRH
jgi:GPH family glycoside/pentoside/hexuronide:cation symporter